MVQALYHFFYTSSGNGGLSDFLRFWPWIVRILLLDGCLNAMLGSSILRALQMVMWYTGKQYLFLLAEVG